MILLGFDDDGKPRTRKPKRAITLRHLITHTSGFSYDLFNKDVARYMEQQGLPSIATCMNASLRAPLLFEPGERWEYGIGIDWAGKIVEAVSGRKLEHYLQDEFFGPLGMKDTSFLLRDDMKRRLVATTQRQPDGSIARIEMEFPQDADFHMGGGGLFSTGPDYLRFTRMLLGGGALDGVRVLAPETVRKMGENAIGDDRGAADEERQPGDGDPVRVLARADQALGSRVHAEHRRTSRAAAPPEAGPGRACTTRSSGSIRRGDARRC